LAPCVDSGRVLLHDVLQNYSPVSASRLRTGFFSECSGSGLLDDSTGRYLRGGNHHLAGERSTVQTFSLELETHMNWSRFAVWLSLVLHAHGNDILRIKGLLELEGLAAPVLINSVRHLVYFPEHLKEWPDGNRSSRLVFIVRNLDPSSIERS